MLCVCCLLFLAVARRETFLPQLCKLRLGRLGGDRDTPAFEGYLDAAEMLSRHLLLSKTEPESGNTKLSALRLEHRTTRRAETSPPPDRFVA